MAAAAATMWGLTGKPGETIRKTAVDAFNELGKGTIEVTNFQNDPYKAKIRTAIGAGEAPTLIFGWGGGDLEVLRRRQPGRRPDELGRARPGFKDKFLPSTWGAATFDEKIYAVPIQTTQPILMYYNKSLFEKAGAQLPQTWDDVMNLVGVFNGQGVAAVLPGRPVEVDVDDVAGVPAGPDRRPGGVRQRSSPTRRTHGRIRR